MEGGLLFVTSRIPIVDMLRKSIPSHLIGGIIVARAHEVGALSTENFILRLFREHNKNGFVQSYSDNCIALKRKSGSLEKAMKNLFVTTVYLWPRFHDKVLKSFPRQLDVTGFDIPMSLPMKKIHNGLVSMIVSLPTWKVVSSSSRAASPSWTCSGSPFLLTSLAESLLLGHTRWAPYPPRTSS
eukprot:TRINITY_DN8146_c0_g1_i1.p1 TRINITY_DN8146_c0_g1~~TRINITY_DN8146_c0_g1_i1.p1  ORF type:complete len:184 (+),score=18.50 TRINITY_DN8146_c0_g1_i1:261-812(+)